MIQKQQVTPPELCLALLPQISCSRKDIKMKISPIIIVRYETKYTQTDYNWPCTVADAIKYVDEYNEGIDVTKAEREAMLVCSMFSRWSNYENILERFKKLEAEGKL